jgi:flagellar hook assembly protein FlgD
VTVRVFDVSGRLERNLAEERLPAGSHTVRWDGRADSGVRVASGVYFYRLEAASGLESKKVVLLR